MKLGSCPHFILFWKMFFVQYCFNSANQSVWKFENFEHFHVFVANHSAIFEKVQKCKTFKKFDGTIF